MPTESTLTDEQRVRMAVPDARWFIGDAGARRGVWGTHNGLYISWMAGCWHDAVQHPTVQAREKALEARNG